MTDREKEVKHNHEMVDQNGHDFLGQIPQANPIQKRQILAPQSIFPLKPLPSFKYFKENIQPTLPSITNPQIFQLQSQKLKDIFASPIYCFSNRIQRENNLQYGCIRVKYAQSRIHRQLNDQNNQISENSQDLSFQSRFQSGNLSLAAKAPNNSYYLLVTRDMNTTKCTQWFFFRAENKAAGRYTFHILNFIKNYSVFDNGMKICVAEKSEGFKWHRGGEDIKYRKTNIPVYSSKSGKKYYSLSFTYQFEKANDQVYFAYCYPYTYSMLEKFLYPLIDENPHIKRRNLAVSPGGNYVDLLTITNFKQKKNQKKRIVFITSRVHPGETPSSFVCEGMIKFLVGQTEQAKSLRDNFIFRVVPMLNPDGVINGSYRCSLAGCDLNRVWHRADKISHPQIFGVKKSIYELYDSNMFLFVDLHAHSKKKGVFMYGCQSRVNPYLCRQIPFLLWKNIPEFNYYQCNFSMRKGREGTSRLSVYRDMELGYSYTMQHSFCGPSKDKVHFCAKDFLNIGQNFMLTLHKYYCRMKKDGKTMDMDIFQELYSCKDLMKVGDNEDADSSSDGDLDHEVEKQPEKPEDKKLFQRRQNNTNSLEMADFQKPKQNIKSRYKMEAERQFDVKNQTVVRFSSKSSSLSKPLPIIGPNFKEDYKDEVDTNYIFNRSRACFSSLNNNNKSEDERETKIKEMFRYNEDEDGNGLNNLFLPSLKNASYKKYGRKVPTQKNMVYVGKTFIQNAKYLKEEIKGVEKKKPNWKEQARSFL